MPELPTFSSLQKALAYQVIARIGRQPGTRCILLITGDKTVLVRWSARPRSDVDRALLYNIDYTLSNFVHQLIDNPPEAPPDASNLLSDNHVALTRIEPHLWLIAAATSVPGHWLDTALRQAGNDLQGLFQAGSRAVGDDPH
jgi:hypothetical protein